MTSASLFSWLRELDNTQLSDEADTVTHLWPLALDVIEAHERMRVGLMDEYDDAQDQMRKAHLAFLKAAEKERA